MDTLAGRASRRQQTPRHLVPGTTCPVAGGCPGRVGTPCPVTAPRVLGTMAPMPEVPRGRATSVPSAEPDVVDTRASEIAVVAGALTVALTAGSIVLGLADDVPPAAPGLAGAVFGVTGGVVAARRPRLVVGWMLLVVGLALTLASFCLGWARHALVVDPGSLPAGELALWLGTWVWVVGYCVLAALLPLRLPDGARPVGAWRVVWWASLAVSVLAVAGWALTPYDQLDRPPLDGLDPSVTSPRAPLLGPVLLAVSLPLLAVCSLAGLVSLVQRLRRSVGEERQQAKWVVWGAVLSIALLGLGQVIGPEGGSDVLLARRRAAAPARHRRGEPALPAVGRRPRHQPDPGVCRPHRPRGRRLRRGRPRPRGPARRAHRRTARRHGARRTRRRAGPSTGAAARRPRGPW